MINNNIGDKRMKKLFFTACVVLAIVSVAIAPYISRIVDNREAGHISGGNYQGIMPFSGDGSLGNPFMISDGAAFRDLLVTHAATPQRAFTLTSNIDLSDINWAPIPFFAAGSIIDGNGFTINGLTITTGAASRGMFVNFHGTIRNVNFTQVSVQGQLGGSTMGTAVGVIAGQISGYLGTNEILFENVRLQTGNIGLDILPTAQSGGFIGAISATGTSVTNRAKVTIRNSYNRLQFMRGGNSSGGLIGIVGNLNGATLNGNLDVLIENSFHEGNIHTTNNCLGGLIGTFWHTTNVTAEIRNSFAVGTYRAEGTFAGGIVGILYTNAQLTLRNVFAIGSISSSMGPNGGLLGGVGWAGNGNNFRAYNSFFSSTLFTGNIAGSGQIAANVITSGSRTTAYMHGEYLIGGISFLDLINDGSDNFVQDIGSHPRLRVFTERVFFTFNANGGEFSPSVYTIEHNRDYELAFVGSEIPEPSRFAHTFGGWQTLSNGGELFPSLVNIPTNTSRTLYARWNRIMFNVEATETGGQSIHFFNAVDPHPISHYSIYQRGFIQTYLPSDDGNTFFIGFEVLIPGTTTWESLGDGRRFLTGNALEHRLDLWTLEDGYIMDEDFIRDFVNTDNNTINFRAIFVTQPPMQVTFEAHTGQSGFGQIRVDGVPRPFGSVVPFAQDHATPISIEITPNRHRTLVAFQRSLDNGITWITVPTSVVGGVHIASYIPSHNLRLRVEFGVQNYSMRVMANHTGASAGVSNTAWQNVSIGGSFAGTTINSIQGYRLISDFAGNVRIWNRLANTYEYFSAINGNVNFNNMDTYFLDRFLHNGQITVYAVFVRQFAVTANVNDLNLGSLVFTVIDRYGATTHPSALNTYDEGTTVIIGIIPTGAARIDSIVGHFAHELNTQGNIITINLISNRNITVNFAIADYFVEVWAMDADDNDIDPSIITTFVSDAGPLNENDTIVDITVTYDSDAFQFQGWYAVVAGDFRSLNAFTDFSDNSIRNLLINEAFISGFADGNDFFFVARFAQIHAVVFDIAGFGVAGQGFFTAQVVVLENGLWVPQGAPIATEGVHPFPQGTRLLITAIPVSQFFALQSIDGLNLDEIIQDNSVIIVVDGFRSFFITFIERRFAITPVFDLGMGTATVNAASVAVGDIVTISFQPTTAFQIRAFRLNGVIVNRTGNVAMITITEAWLAANYQNGIVRFNVEITTVMNQFFVWGLITAAIIVPLLVILLILVMRSNQRKKVAYNELMEKRKQHGIMHGQVDQLKKIRGE